MSPVHSIFRGHIIDEGLTGEAQAEHLENKLDYYETNELSRAYSFKQISVFLSWNEHFSFDNYNLIKYICHFNNIFEGGLTGAIRALR